MSITKSGWDLLRIRPIQVTENISLHVHNGKLIEKDIQVTENISLQVYNGNQIKKTCEHPTNTSD
jgi:hypothetical protein